MRAAMGASVPAVVAFAAAWLTRTELFAGHETRQLPRATAFLTLFLSRSQTTVLDWWRRGGSRRFRCTQQIAFFFPSDRDSLYRYLLPLP